jgi:hypothetical protein
VPLSALSDFQFLEPRVPRFLFNVWKEGLCLAAISEELPCKSTAITTARRMARELLTDTEGEWIATRIEVADEYNEVIGVIDMNEYWLQ